MSHSLQQSRRPSVSIYEYPEDLNPFKDDLEQVELRKPYISSNNDTNAIKEHKNKFWTFGKGRKKRTNSFSIKSTWNGIFGKRKDSDGDVRKPTGTPVSSTHRNTSCNPETAASQLSRDQQEFNQALWTLSRRRKYTLDSSSRYGSNLTVNGDPKRIYAGCPQETTASILGDLTPKPPARRFGQINSKYPDEIPPLNYGNDYQNKNIDVENCSTPVPPKRSGLRSSQRLHTPSSDTDEHNLSAKCDTMIDENENMPEDYIFKRCNNNSLQKSNLSINSCLSMASVYHSGRKKRRAPQPPVNKSTTNSLHDFKQESNTDIDNDAIDNRKNVESIDIVKQSEDIDEISNQNQSLNEDSTSSMVNNSQVSLEKVENEKENSPSITNLINNSNEINTEVIIINNEIDRNNVDDNANNLSNDDTQLKIELKKEISECVEIVKDVDTIEDIDDSVILRKKESSVHLSSNESFCVKEEIEKIERQIKLLETNKVRSRTCSLSYNDDDNINDDGLLQRSASRRSLQENRRNFFRDLTKNNKNDHVKVEIKEFPREQNDIKIVRLSESPISNTLTTISVGPEKPVKVIELHISEPIKQKPEFTVTETDINPVPKPRRHGVHYTDNNDKLNVSNSHSAKVEEDEESASSL